jgi:hypothetical protein
MLPAFDGVLLLLPSCYAELCTARGTCLPGGSHTAYTLNYQRLPYAMLVKSGGVLVFSNIQLFNLAPGATFTYNSSTPYRSTGQGTTTWPSIGLAPNATVSWLAEVWHTACMGLRMQALGDRSSPLQTAECTQLLLWSCWERVH